MDPVSFTASLVTVSALVITSSQNILTLRQKLKNASKDVGDLLEQLRTFEGLLQELETQLREHQNDAPPQETLQHLWGTSLGQMERDVKSFDIMVSKIEQLLTAKFRRSKLLLSARHMLSEKKVAQYQRNIEAHCNTLTNIQTLVCG